MLKRDEFEKKHGKKAFARILQEVESKAARKTTDPSARALLLEHSSMEANERAVDNLIARLTKNRTAKGVDRAVQSLASFDSNQLDDVIADDLLELAFTLMRWL